MKKSVYDVTDYPFTTWMTERDRNGETLRRYRLRFARGERRGRRHGYDSGCKGRAHRLKMGVLGDEIM